ncbi:1-acyl-sn-glycerol-3-phosphate acyltransferase [Candidatus Neomarinimicrobiota bacterium]
MAGIVLPLWLVILGSVFALWSVLDRLLLPSVRWFIRRRVNLVIGELNDLLDLRLPAFKLTQRRVLVDRLTFDPKILAAVEEYCSEHEIPNDVAMQKVERYAREIVPAFNAYLYFRFGSWLAKTIAQKLYRVRLGYTDEEGLRAIDSNASVVFVMNHRSNMDYILVSYLAFNKALSYAIGEWARVWPVQQLARAMGAFFVRRGSGNQLYRRVLCRYVQMSAEAGVVQAVFPEGGLTKTGQLQEPRIGLLKYMVESFDPDGERDLVFIPVAVNYDRVLEDRTLLHAADPHAEKKSGGFAMRTTLRFAMHNFWLMFRGGWYSFGYAAANFGTPISMRDYVQHHQIDLRQLSGEVRIEAILDLARELMQSVGEMIPVLPVSLIAYAFAEQPDRAFSDLELKVRVQSLIGDLEQKGAQVYIPRGDRDYALTVGLRMLTLRHIVLEEDRLYSAAPGELPILRYYANALTHFIPLKT